MVLLINTPEGALAGGIGVPAFIVFISGFGTGGFEQGNGNQVFTFQLPPYLGAIITDGPPFFKTF